MVAELIRDRSDVHIAGAGGGDNAHSTKNVDDAADSTDESVDDSDAAVHRVVEFDVPFGAGAVSMNFVQIAQQWWINREDDVNKQKETA